MAKILIKRGLQSKIGSETLEPGELAVATDTGNVYIGTDSGNLHINPTGGAADTAGKLATARNISLTGAVTATPAAFDGSKDIQITVTSVDAQKLTGVIDGGTF